MQEISAFYLENQKSIVPKKICSMLLIKTLKSKMSDFLNSNMCFCLQLYGSCFWVQGKSNIKKTSV